MKMFWEFFSFEIKFRLKSLSTYVYFLLWFALSFLFVAAEDFGPVGNGKVLLNGPWAISVYYIQLSLFGVIVIAAIFGTSILRDFQRDTYQLLFTKPISKFAYLGGRWAGSMVATTFAFSGMVFGVMAGTLAPWADHTRISSGHLWWYFQPFLSFVVVQIFFLGTLFFCVAALTRKIIIVYLQGVAIFMVYVIGITVFFATRSLEHFWSGILDPVGILLLDNVTRYWTVAEKNSLLMPLTGVFLYNRLLWAGIGVAALVAVLALFPMSVEALTAVASGRRASKAKLQEQEEVRPKRSLVAPKLPTVRQVFGPATSWQQLLSLTRLRISIILHEIPFWAIVAILIAFAVNNGYFAGRLAGRDIWPVTFLMVQAVEGSATLFFYIVATLYAAELIWRERDTHFDGIHDALPMRETTDWLSKFLALAFVEVILLCVTLLCGVFMQTIAGYYHYEFAQYFKELFVVTFPQVLVFALFAFFIQTVVSNKFIGHGILIGLFVSLPILFRYGFENTLYLPGAIPVYTYSDMNGYGHFAPALAWSIVYWFAIAAVLGVISIALTRRGSDDSWASRTRLATQRLPRLIPALALFLILAAASGTWYYWNAHVFNEFLTARQRRDAQADYERSYKKYQQLPQPKIISVDTNINIYPERRSFDGTGYLDLQNKTAQSIEQIHLTDQMQSVKSVTFDRPFHRVSAGPRNIYSIYALEKPLQPGETLRMNFQVGYTSHGFKDNNERPELAYNGTFFDSNYLPFIGYDRNMELDDPRRRLEEKLGPLEELAQRGDPYYDKINLFTSDSDWISYHTVVSTSSDQIAIAPGYLKKEWQENGRHSYEYDMGATKTLDFYSYLSGRYQIKQEQWRNVKLQIFYNAGHEYDLDDMLAATKSGLDYYDKSFGPYQFDQFRIIEFPRYRQFAQSFPNTIPYSEDIGFLARMKKPDDIDFTYFVTAHELGHQWWGHQLIGGNVQGSNMLSETLAEYSALKVMEKKYGSDNIHKYLKHELDAYLRGRAGEIRKEPPLVLVQREPYVWYQKGGLVMYTLADYIGEDKVNAALKNFLDQYKYANAVDKESVAYPDTRQFVAALREQTPPDMQYLITDMFESIVLYDNKALTATVTPTSDHKFKVSLAVQARKSKADENGNESPMPLNDYIDIGIFTGKKDQEKPLYLQKQKLTQEHQTFEITVDQMPTRAGIDPYNKLIDRVADDNIIDVTKP
jgi:ABC-type transport system involved in multi-copper enzyme maturation permease subunit